MHMFNFSPQPDRHSSSYKFTYYARGNVMYYAAEVAVQCTYVIGNWVMHNPCALRDRRSIIITCLPIRLTVVESSQPSLLLLNPLPRPSCRLLESWTTALYLTRLPCSILLWPTSSSSCLWCLCLYCLVTYW